MQITVSSVPQTVSPGGVVSTTIYVVNNGTTAATNVDILSALPTLPGVTRTWTATASAGITLPATSGTGPINALIPTVPPGGTITYFVQDRIPFTANGQVGYIASACVNDDCACQICAAGNPVPISLGTGCVKLPPGLAQCDYLEAMQNNGIQVGCGEADGQRCVEACNIALLWKQGSVNAASTTLAAGTADPAWIDGVTHTISVACKVVIRVDTQTNNDVYVGDCQNGVVWRVLIDNNLYWQDAPGIAPSCPSTGPRVQKLPFYGLNAGDHTIKLQYRRIGTGTGLGTLALIGWARECA